MIVLRSFIPLCISFLSTFADAAFNQAQQIDYLSEFVVYGFFLLLFYEFND